MNDVTFVQVTLKGYHDIRDLKNMMRDEYKDVLIDAVLGCYVDEVGGSHEGGTGTDPDGNNCGECFHLSCKDCCCVQR